MTTAVLYPFVSAYSQADKVLELINIRNQITGVKLSSLNCKLGIPAAKTPGENLNHNTSVLVQAILGRDYHGSRQMVYDRLDIEKYLFGITPVMPVAKAGDAVTVVTVANWLRTTYGLDVVPADLTISQIDTTTLPVNGKITIHSESLLWYGSFNFTVDYDALDLTNLLQVTVLDGFLYPNSDLTRGQAQVYSWWFNGTDFTHELETKLVNDSATTNAVEELLTTISDDDWVISGTAAPFNLSGATIAYNGPVANCGLNINTKYSKVLVLQLGSLCSNLGGKLTIWYGLT